MSHKASFAGGLFADFHDELMGVSIDFDAFDASAFDAALVHQARHVWLDRFRTEFRSTQIMTRFMSEVLGAGDPIDIYAGGVDLIEDEVRHAALCAGMCRALGIEPSFPDPVRLDDPEDFLKAPMAERALHTAITMVAISETLSFGFITDLQARCEEPTVSAVLEATVADEEGHQDFGWVYIEKSLSRFPESTLDDWRHLVRTTLEPHKKAAEQALAQVPDEKRIELGMFSPQRQALVFEKTYREVVEPRLESVGLLG